MKVLIIQTHIGALLVIKVNIQTYSYKKENEINLMISKTDNDASLKAKICINIFID